MRRTRFDPARACALLGVCAYLLPHAITAQPARAPDPSEPTTPVAQPRYESVFQGREDNGTDRARLPWKRLFKPDGSFVPEGQLVGQDPASPSPQAGSSEAAGESASGTPAAAQPVAGSDARGTVKAIYPDRGKIKLKHGPIDKLDMPGMTMVFQMQDPSRLQEVNKGDEIDFSIEMRGSAFVVTDFKPTRSVEVSNADAGTAAAPSTSAKGQEGANGGSDSRGTVKAIYAERGKVKLKHGPIEKLDMPGMTMVFRVKDPALLDVIKKGEEVGFTVEMQGSAFVITGFQP